MVVVPVVEQLGLLQLELVLREQAALAGTGFTVEQVVELAKRLEAVALDTVVGVPDIVAVELAAGPEPGTVGFCTSPSRLNRIGTFSASQRMAHSSACDLRHLLRTRCT